LFDDQKISGFTHLRVPRVEVDVWAFFFLTLELKAETYCSEAPSLIFFLAEPGSCIRKKIFAFYLSLFIRKYPYRHCCLGMEAGAK
jgi:hypothetical protein